MAQALPAIEPEAVLGVESDVWQIATDEPLQFIDITERVLERVRRSGIRHGLVTLQTRHTTTAVVVNENEPLLIQDMVDMLERTVPRDAPYRHHDFARRQTPPDESPNGHSHCRALLLGASETLCIVAGSVSLGTWQRVFFVELDGPRKRTLCCTVLGTR